MSILLTRPLTDSLKLQSLLQKHGFETFIEPMLKISPILSKWPTETVQSFSFIIITSRHALELLCHNHTVTDNFSLLIVGKQTAHIAMTKGFYVQHSTENSQELLTYILSMKNIPSLLYLRGQNIMFDLPCQLQQHGIPLTVLVVYQAVARKYLSKKIINFISEMKIKNILFFSRRTLNIFNQLIERYQLQDYLLHCHAICLSAHIAEEWHFSKHITIAQKPNQESLIEVVLKC